MRLLLVSPHPLCSMIDPEDFRRFLLPSLSLPLLAALTPEEFEVEIVDEAVETLDPEARADLVGITLPMSHLAPRAYALSDHFRGRGIPVVLGGAHASILPEEATSHADSVVVGEAEGVWTELLADFQWGALRQIYHRPGPSLHGLPLPRWELLRGAYRSRSLAFTSRGCPRDCAFCSVNLLFGSRVRHRPVEEVIAEVARMESPIFFVDDDIAVDPAYARQLFERLIPLGKQWASQASIHLAFHPALLKLATRSGCFCLMLGLESLNQVSLQGAGKPFQAAEYAEAILRLHDRGILVHSLFLFGLDGDDPSIFERTAAFHLKHRIDLATLSIATPLPGTRFRASLEAEGRIFDRDWEHYDSKHVVFRPRRMTPEELHEGFWATYREIYSVGSIARRLLRPSLQALSCWKGNWSYRRAIYKLGLPEPPKTTHPISGGGPP